MEYKTTDIYLTTTLIVQGAELKEVTVDEGLKRQAVFVLQTNNMNVESFIQLYKMKKLPVDAFTFVDTFKDVKQRMFERLNVRT